MKTNTEQYVWELLENLGFDLTEDNKTSELAQECINNIDNRYVNFYKQREIKDFSKRYFKCSKCSCKTSTDNNKTPDYICTNGAVHRTSGICGGAFDIEITEGEFKTFND